MRRSKLRLAWKSIQDTTAANPAFLLGLVAHSLSTARRAGHTSIKITGCPVDIQVTVTVDDPAYYAQPFQLLKANYYWMKKTGFRRDYLPAVDALEYREKLAAPSGWGETATKP